jgi:PAS domain-containing protein
VLVIDNPPSICGDCLLAKEYRGRSAMTIRLEHEKKIYGLMSVSVPREYINAEEERELLAEVAGDIAFALHAMELEENRKQAEEEVRLLSSAVEQSTEGMAIADLEGNLTYANKAWAKMHGYESFEDLIGRHLSIFHNQE